MINIDLTRGGWDEESFRERKVFLDKKAKDELARAYKMPTTDALFKENVAENPMSLYQQEGYKVQLSFYKKDIQKRFVRQSEEFLKFLEDQHDLAANEVETLLANIQSFLEKKFQNGLIDETLKEAICESLNVHLNEYLDYMERLSGQIKKGIALVNMEMSLLNVIRKNSIEKRLQELNEMVPLNKNSLNHPFTTDESSEVLQKQDEKKNNYGETSTPTSKDLDDLSGDKRNSKYVDFSELAKTKTNNNLTKDNTVQGTKSDQGLGVRKNRNNRKLRR